MSYPIRLPFRLKVYRDRGGTYRWRLIARNGKIVADSGEGYTRPRAARAMARRLFRGLSL